MITLKVAAEYVQTSKASRAFLAVIMSVKRIFDFAQERANRPVRFLRVVRAYRNGKPVRDIVQEYGCSNNTVLRYARMAGLPKRPKTDDPERRAKIIKLSKQGGMSQVQIAKECNCSVALVSIVEHEAGLKRYRGSGKQQ